MTALEILFRMIAPVIVALLIMSGTLSMAFLISKIGFFTSED
jgi:hypothetical protein